MKTKIQHTIYVIKESNKGWSEVFCIYFSKERAEAKLKELLAIPKHARNNFKLERWYAEDCVIYEENADKPF